MALENSEVLENLQEQLKTVNEQYERLSVTRLKLMGAIDVLTMAGYTPIGALFLIELDFLNPSLSVPYRSVIHYDV